MEERLNEVLNGTAEARVAPFLWMHGENQARIADELQKIHDCGIRAVCLESRPYEDFCGEKWWNDLRFLFGRLQRLGMKAWILDDKHYPTGFANGAVISHPESGAWGIKAEFIDVAGPVKNACALTEQWKDDPADEIVAVIACRRKKESEMLSGETLDLTESLADGAVWFDLPKGVWRIFCFVKTRSGMSQRFKQYVDMLSPDAGKLMIEAVYEPHYKHLKDLFGTTFLGFFSDEPGFGSNTARDSSLPIGTPFTHYPWHSCVQKQLTDTYGDKALRLLPALWYSFADGRESAFRIRYMDIVTNEYRKNFSEPLGDWCRAHGVRYIGHIIEDNHRHVCCGTGAGHYFRALAGQDMSGVDVVLHQIIPGLTDYPNRGCVSYRTMNNKFFHYYLAKLASSDAAISDHMHGDAMCEIFGAYGWAEGSKIMKYLMDHMLVRGINYFVPHAFSLNTDDPDCPPQFYSGGKNPEYPYFGELMGYLERMSSLFSGGEAVVTCSLLYDAENHWSGAPFIPLEDTAKALYDNQLDYEIVPFEQLGAATAPIIAASDCAALPAEYQKQLDLAGNVFKIGRDFTPDALARFIRKNGFADVTAKDYCPLLRYRHYKRNHTDFYLLTNEDIYEAIDTTITLGAFSGGEYLEYDGMANRAVRKKSDGEITLHLPPYHSIVLIFGEKELSAFEHEKPAPEFKFETAVDGPFSIFLAKSNEDFHPYVVTKELFNIVSPGHETRFAGTVRYDFTIDAPKNGAYRLDLGEVGEIAKLEVNGQKIGTALFPPYVFDLQLQKGENKVSLYITSHRGYEKRDEFSKYLLMEPVGLLGPVILKKQEESPLFH